MSYTISAQIGSKVFVFTDKDFPPLGKTLTKTQANILNSMFLSRFSNQMKKYINTHPDATCLEVLQKAKDLHKTIDILSISSNDADLIFTEARNIAREIIIASLLKRNHDFPSNVEEQVSRLAQFSESIQLKAQERIALGRTAVCEIMARIVE